MISKVIFVGTASHSTHQIAEDAINIHAKDALVGITSIGQLETNV
jgi:hypothetical protein